ncbi:pyridoxamine 5'-phosphate oxidase family protein [Clostridium formicaceticum]|uniref:Pyridoxamine 5'-phosphate oxidase n=1 Tax=Clostridium formicaceticum TaxID=1497 RepID=A0AAC9RKD1_9CLOT|nr:pyridoxamine 5'-phosphate oxidase family protein [Clostridium formicaceticum]AOY76809.1 pyridoxamine 5'-phosphate oxidase [Clostridium formicaceticum]ARE87277.1 Pyridoxamine 5'-phosphate oxidase [Clostridium formicaceticum]
MRRSEKEVRDIAEIEEILKRADICRLGLCVDNIPYVVPMSFGYKNNCLYLHSAKEGKKIDIMKANPKVCFELEVDTELVKKDIACNWGMKFISIIGFGIVRFIEEKLDKKEALNIIMSQYSKDKTFEYRDEQIEAVTVIEIMITEMNCKKSGY